MSIPLKDNQKHRPFSARGAALLLWSAKDEEVLMEGPAGTGKTRTLLEKGFFCALKYDGCRILLCRKTRESMTESVLVTWETKVVPAGDKILDGPKRNLRQSYRFDNGSEVVVGGMDKASKVMSTEYDLILCFETTEFTEEDLENLTTRLRNHVIPYQQLIADCNPGPPQHWLNKRAHKGKMRRLLSRHRDNPVLYTEDERLTPEGKTYVSKLERLSGARRSRLLDGIWAAQEGMVYEAWDPALHLVDSFKIPPTWRKIRVIDFGYVNPFICQWWAMDNDGRMFMYREIYMSHRTVADHAEVIRRLSGNENYEVTLADHDAEDRATLEQNNIFTRPAHKEITPGIEAVQLRLRHDGGAKPRLFLFRGATYEIDRELEDKGFPYMTQQEFDGYSYPKVQEGKAEKEIPVDKDNHGMDAMRYAVAYIDDLAGMKINVTVDEAVTISQEEALAVTRDKPTNPYYLN